MKNKMSTATKFLLLVFGLTSPLMAVQVDQNFVPTSSYTDVDTSGPIFLSSTPIQFIAVNISSTAAGSLIIWRSTSASFTQDLASQTVINTGSLTVGQTIAPIPLYDMTNTSYTYIQKIGKAQLTYFFRCPNVATKGGLCPGLRYFGQQ